MSDPVDEAEQPKDPGKPNPLDYAPPAPKSGGVAAPVSFTGGFVLAVGALGCLGSMWYVNLKPIGGPTLPHQAPPVLPVFTFAIMAVGAVVGIVLITRQQRAGHPRWFLLGLLVGLGLTALLEGICFQAG
jgi:hypothetical protein